MGNLLQEGKIVSDYDLLLLAEFPIIYFPGPVPASKLSHIC